MKRVLFLDIDGVLNSVGYFMSRGRVRPADGRPFWQHDIDPGAVHTLDLVVQASDAEVVLSSTWRLTNRLDELSGFLSALGLSKHLAGATPAWHTQPSGSIVGTYPTRGLEIQAWLDTQADRPEAIAIVDDDTDMGDLMPWLVKTDPERGITRANAAELLEVLRRPAPEARP